ncbi:MAG: hypothetical protein UW64_C0003G0062 [Microgenomates group bacterium GW2011_GWC1_44_37]|uniref:Glycosyltransferase RgtA/B/C/D-like domain-containing protein n=1 Tax=Candidatus Collierbacteria bacterium GW2011_GWB2_44_22 TaxID=1618387 RepID=A0A0G1KX44_9BACT|nr:MAG: hypothetical protein UW31_C0005G0061 [Candidatus Collierbacteria bacterium GW2011_GWA2_44_13]KKT50946.1 MAG: hypothetical protein UW42_C0012G0009 [Candidatus Collierbacteria bacterium GW2011_GWB1_44_197]KKT52509.1 MAG: hypothetical protein UW44_C0001G0061 [Candidatus Collierbacteria bacterium GW2011_GWB2_44_22]KKT62732.1 MAG: hypothetical protein UW56_C0004G0045 [Candidatus Collierbacteria bacterium GW2011_GWD1_44_27]KKT66509.1 MAG: hypothetical protein UW58_C0007G0029 [Candidatus Colli
MLTMYLWLIALLGLVLRLMFSNQSFWLDEGASLMFGKLPLSQLMESIKTDFHPPIFYSLLHFWLPFAGKSEWLIRLPFILLATATIPALYFLCREIFGSKSKVPLLSAIFLSLNPLHIYYSQELRMYSLTTLIVVSSWYFLVRKKYLIVSLFNLLGFFTFYGVVFNIVSQLIYLLFQKPKNILWTTFYLIFPTVILFLFWWPTFSTQLSNGRYLTSALPGWQILSGSLTLKSLLLIPLKFVLGRISLEPLKLYFLAGGTITTIFLIVTVRSFLYKKALPLTVSLLVPLLLGALLSLKTPVLGYWRFLFVLPFFLALLAVGVESLPKIIYLGTVAWICGVFFFANLYFWNNPRFHREDWRGLTAFLSGKNSLVLLAFPYKFAPINYYVGSAEYLPMQTGSYNQKPYLETELSEKISNHATIYYLDYLADLTDPKRVGLQSLSKFGLKQVGVYNFNNLGQVFEFRRL